MASVIKSQSGSSGGKLYSNNVNNQNALRLESATSTSLDPRSSNQTFESRVIEQNASKILNIPHVDGLLVGGISLKLDEFWEVINASEK